jgi:hypothetical protein
MLCYTIQNTNIFNTRISFSYFRFNLICLSFQWLQRTHKARVATVNGVVSAQYIQILGDTTKDDFSGPLPGSKEKKHILNSDFKNKFVSSDSTAEVWEILPRRK